MGYLDGVLGGVLDARLDLFLRQASEHTNTSAQFLAQALRQTMGRWHTTQSLLGSAALLPLKVGITNGRRARWDSGWGSRWGSAHRARPRRQRCADTATHCGGGDVRFPAGQGCGASTHSGQMPPALLAPGCLPVASARQPGSPSPRHQVSGSVR